MLSPKEKTHLSEIYSHFLSTGNRSMHYIFSTNISEKRDTVDCLDALCDEGYIFYEYQSTGFYGVKLTPKGIRCAENNYQDSFNAPHSIYGSNNIIVNGSQNEISGNYNQFVSDINSLEIPPEFKELIENLLYELKNPKLSKEKRFSKIRQFLSDVSSSALSGTAETVLTQFLMCLFAHINL